MNDLEDLHPIQRSIPNITLPRARLQILALALCAAFPISGCGGEKSSEHEQPPIFELPVGSLTIKNQGEIIKIRDQSSAHIQSVWGALQASTRSRLLSRGQSPNQGPLRIAVIDNGFQDIEALMGGVAPSQADKFGYPIQPVRIRPDGQAAKTKHGTTMIELVWLAGTQYANLVDPNRRIQIYPIVSNGKQGFAWAADQVIELDADVVLHAQVFTGGGKAGRGYVDRIVQKVTERGVLWVNATGNHQGSSLMIPRILQNTRHPTHIAFDAFPENTENKQSILFEIRENSSLKLELAHDLSSYEDEHTDFPVEFCLTQKIANIPSTQVFCSHNSNKKDNVLIDPDLAQMNYFTTLPPGTYSLNLFPSRSLQRRGARNDSGNLWLNFQLQNLDLPFFEPYPTTIQTPILAPNDHPAVVSVSASDSNLNPFLTSKGKLFTAIASRTVLDNDTEIKSSSTASAIFLGSFIHSLQNGKLNP
jgi:hypothetical protein